MATTVRLIPSSYRFSSTNLSMASESNMYANTDSSSYATITNNRTSTSSYYLYIQGFNFGAVPSDAIVSSIEIKLKAYHSGGNTSTIYGYTYDGSTASQISAAGSTTALWTSATTKTFSNTTIDWNTLKGYGANFGIRINCRRSNRNTPAYIYVYGVEIDVTYTVPVQYSVTINNSTSATVTASNTAPYEGDNVTITADTLTGISITDNGTDVTNQFVHHSGTTGDYSIENRDSYGFALSNGYYVSQNKGVSKSAAVCRISFTLPVTATVTISYINYAEASYDFGVFGNVDTALSTDYYAAGSSGATITDSSYKKACNTSADNTSSIQTLTYTNVPAGSHFIDVKYSKDDASNANNDTLQFQVAITYSQSVSYYSYEISNISANHTIVVSSSVSQQTIYFKANGAWVAASAVYKKVSGVWVQQSDLSNVFQSGTNYVKGN